MKSSIFILILATTLLLSAISGCDRGVTPVSKNQVPEKTMPSGHVLTDKKPVPTASKMPKVERKVIIPEEVEKGWTQVTLKVTDKKTGKTEDLWVEIGGSVKLPGTDLTVEVPYFLPNFLMGDGKITSVDNELANPAAKIIIKRGDMELHNHWSFAKHPEVHGFQHPVWSISLVGGVATAASKN